MAWSVGPLTIDNADELEQKLADAFEGRKGDREREPKVQEAQLARCQKLLTTLLKAPESGEGPYEVSISAHPAVEASGSRPYISLSVVGSSPESSG